MGKIEIIAQIIGIFGMASNILSYQFKNKLKILIFQMCGAAFFSINFFLLGAIAGAVVNIINVALSLVFMYKDKTHAYHIAWSIGFSVLYVSAYVLSFLVFGVEPTAKNLITEFFPLIGAITTVISYRIKNASAIRKIGLIRSPAWLTYDILTFSIGGILCEIFTLISIITAILRYGEGKRKNIIKE